MIRDDSRLDPVAALVAIGLVGAVLLLGGHWLTVLVGATVTGVALALALAIVAGFRYLHQHPEVRRALATCSLVAIALLMLLIVLPALQTTGRGPANVAAARSFLGNIAQALAEYERDHGVYPASDAQMSGRPLLVYLDGDPTNGGPTKLYYEFRADAVDEAGRPTDPWGRPYRYLENRARLSGGPPTKMYFDNGSPDPVSTGGWNWASYDVWSTGSDPAEQDYIGNW